MIFAIAGCSKGPRIVPVQGKVLVDGAPLGIARIQFAPMATGDNINPGKPAFGEIMADGTFTMSTMRDNDGAVIGKHRVTIFTTASKKDEKDTKSASSSTKFPPFEILRLIDREFVVEEGAENRFVIELTSDYIRQFGERDD